MEEERALLEPHVKRARFVGSLEPIVHIDIYQLQDSDEAVYPHYYGYQNEEGDWYIAQELSFGVFRYTRLVQGKAKQATYAAAWASRTTMSYVYWETTF